MKNTEKEKKNAEIFNYLKTVYIAKTLEMRYQKKTNQEIIDELNLPSQSNQKQNQLKVSSKKHKKKKVKTKKQEAQVESHVPNQPNMEDNKAPTLTQEPVNSIKEVNEQENDKKDSTEKSNNFLEFVQLSNAIKECNLPKKKMEKIEKLLQELNIKMNDTSTKYIKVTQEVNQLTQKVTELNSRVDCLETKLEEISKAPNSIYRREYIKRIFWLMLDSLVIEAIYYDRAVKPIIQKLPTNINVMTIISTN